MTWKTPRFQHSDGVTKPVFARSRLSHAGNDSPSHASLTRTSKCTNVTVLLPSGPRWRWSPDFTSTILFGLLNFHVLCKYRIHVTVESMVFRETS